VSDYFGQEQGNPPAATQALQSRFGPVHHVTLSLMPNDQILSLLLAERDKLSRAIEALSGPTKRRGRPPKNPLAALTSVAAAAPVRKKRKFSAAQRKAAAERMRQMWARKKRAAAKS
jgi:hypothetical protein